MWDILLRALLHPFDYASVLGQRKVSFLHKKDEGGGVWSFIFSAADLSWKAGQHAIFSFPKNQVSGKSWRVFSIASAPHEGVVQISTRIPNNPSSFKQRLIELKPGDALSLRGPLGEFHTHKQTRTIVAVAGGIGITPLRALLLDLEHRASQIEIHLIYAGKESFYAFADEIKSLLPHLKLRVDWVEGEVATAEAIEAAARAYPKADYYISGSPGMINAVHHKLTELGVQKIYNDPFKGYT